MKKIRIGILGTSDIAYKRFLPALKESRNFEYVGVASRQLSRTQHFVSAYGGRGFEAYNELIISEEVDALYIPLPPELHYEWARKALENNKHVLLEKPFTTNMCHTSSLIDLARKKNLALHENYMFVYHRQFNKIQQLISNRAIGKMRLIRMAFGFPFRGSNDFRYNKALGGGALLDCGGYPIKLAGLLLGDTVRVKTARLNYSDGYNVDIFGSATLENDDGLTAQISFGMDNSYKCELEIWGSKGCIYNPRIFTAPTDFKPTIWMTFADKEEKIEVACDNQFLNSIEAFYESIQDRKVCEKNYESIIRQSSLVDDIQKYPFTLA